MTRGPRPRMRLVLDPTFNNLSGVSAIIESRIAHVLGDHRALVLSRESRGKLPAKMRAEASRRRQLAGITERRPRG